MKVTESANSIAQTASSKCGGHLSLKKGKYWDFIGCSNYPKCRYTEAV
ncbi:topoisomerase DNA-binding C4 zinc finger domain-containing protein [Sporosarcina sp. FA9]